MLDNVHDECFSLGDGGSLQIESETPDTQSEFPADVEYIEYGYVIALADEPYDCKLYGDELISPHPKREAELPMRPGAVGAIIAFDAQLAGILKHDAPAGFIALPRLECDATEDAFTAFNPQAKLFAKLEATDDALQADAAQLL